MKILKQRFQKVPFLKLIPKEYPKDRYRKRNYYMKLGILKVSEEKFQTKPEKMKLPRGTLRRKT